jgi:hypothetical protein
VISRKLVLFCCGLALIVASGTSAEVTYEYDGNTYTTIIDNTPPAATTYTTAMGVSGEVTVAAPLPASMPLTDISGEIVSFALDDGANTLTSSNATLLDGFSVATDAFGDIVEWQITAVSGPPLPSTGGPGDQRQVIQTSNGVSTFDRALLQECSGGASGSCGVVFSDLGSVFGDPGVWSFDLEVDLDIKPWSDPNSINPMGSGIIPVAIFGSESVDVTLIDATTLAFGPNGAALVHLSGPHFEDDLGGPYDLNGDGIGDAVVHFATAETGIAWGDTEACVTGEFLTGTPFDGCDEIRTQLACGIGFELALLLPPLMWLRGRRRRPLH